MRGGGHVRIGVVSTLDVTVRLALLHRLLHVHTIVQEKVLKWCKMCRTKPLPPKHNIFLFSFGRIAVSHSLLMTAGFKRDTNQTSFFSLSCKSLKPFSLLFSLLFFLYIFKVLTLEPMPLLPVLAGMLYRGSIFYIEHLQNSSPVYTENRHCNK